MNRDEAQAPARGGSPAAPAPLRLGVLVKGPLARRWEIAAVTMFAGEGGARVVAILQVGEGTVSGRWTRWIEAMEGQVFQDRARQVGKDRARDAFPGARVVPLEDVASEPGASRVRELDLDAIVSLGLSEDLAPFARCTRRGLVECFYDGGRGEAALIRVLVRRPSQIHVEVRRTPPDGSAQEVLGASLAALSGEGFLTETEALVFGRATGLLLRALRAVTACGPVGTTLPLPKPGNGRGSEIRRGSEVRDALRFCVSGAETFGRRRLQNVLLGPDQWFLAYRTDPARFVANRGTFEGDGFRVLVPPAGAFHADPCVIERAGRHHVFLEEYPFATRKGIIAWTELKPDGSLAEPEPVLERPYHLSYPFVFAWEADVFMVPETADNRTVELYRAVDFPRRWELASVLLGDVFAADATLYFEGGRWWMFLAMGEHGSSTCDELFLFHAETPLGPWAPHAMNPIKSDARSARPAGRLFRSGGRLLRPAQDCSETYGGALTLCEVLELDEHAYRERVVERVSPAWLKGNTGLHTLSASSGLEVIDGRRRRGRRSRTGTPVRSP